MKSTSGICRARWCQKFFYFVFISTALSSCTTQSIKNCDVRHIVVFDRTTKLDARSKELVREGTRRILASGFAIGWFYTLEIRGTGLSYEEISPGTEIPPQPALPKIQRCNVDVFGSSYEDCQNRNKKIRYAFDAASEARKQKLNHLLDSFDTLIERDIPDTSDTAISEAINNIMIKYCLSRPCELFVFSDMIERAARKLAHSIHPLSDEVANRTADAQFTNIRDVHVREPGKAEVYVWGVGRDEISGRELPNYGRRSLQVFWRDLFEKMGIEVASMSYELPDLPDVVSGDRCRQH